MQSLKETVNSLPLSPGVYKYYDKEDNLIYIGKAKKLKNRVKSYFNNPNQNRKTLNLVKQINRLEYITVPTEIDALFLENNLIKQHQPKYNILLKDDKTYPYICIVKEDFPRVLITRKVDKSKGEYFGPYISGIQLRSITKFIQKEYKIRTCSLSLTEKNIKSGKYKVCLEYHIKNCLGPCEGLQSDKGYEQNLNQIRKLLKGDYSEIKNDLKKEMQKESESLNYEKANILKQRLENFELFKSKALVVNPRLGNLIVISIKKVEYKGYANYLVVKNGSVIKSNNMTVSDLKTKDIEELLPLIYSNLIAKEDIGNHEIISNVDYSNYLIKTNTPQIGDKKKILNISIKNLDKYIQSKEAIIQPKISPALEQLKSILKLKEIPYHIECFDNSNIQGTNPVSAMVCFKNGKPSKKDYRHFKIKTVEGPNDFESMYEAVTRRYSRLIKEQQALPHIILIDGGKGQLSSAHKALKDLNLDQKITMLGIAKRLEEIYTPGDNDPIYISKKSLALKLFMQLRDEAHRFGITFHRNLRSKQALKNPLENIKGIGDSTIKKLLLELKSLNKIKNSNHETLEEIIGKDKTRIILEAIKKGDI